MKRRKYLNLYLFEYGKYSKTSNTFFFLFVNEMLVLRTGTHEMLVRIANREGPDQTASLEAVRSVPALFVPAFFGRQLMFETLEHFLYTQIDL